MSYAMWCENCRMRLGIDVDCDVAGHVHRPLSGDQTGTDGGSKDGADIVTRLQCAYHKGDEPPCEECTFCAARAEIERLRAADRHDPELLLRAADAMDALGLFSKEDNDE